MLNLGLGYLSLERSTPTLSPGELQRLRLATQLHSNLFGVIYVLDEPSAGLHPADTKSLLDALDALKLSGNSLFVVEHELDVIRRADWIIDVGPGAGPAGGEILYSGPPAGLESVTASQTRRYLFPSKLSKLPPPRQPQEWLKLSGITRNNLEFAYGPDSARRFYFGDRRFRLRKSTLISQVLVELVADHLGQKIERDEEQSANNSLTEALDFSHREGRVWLKTHLLIGGRRPKTYWTHSPLELSYIHGPFRSRPEAVCCHSACALP